MGTMNSLRVQETASGFPVTYFITASSYNNNISLAANVAKSVSVPTGARFALFRPTADFYARWDGSAATVPAADITDGTSSILNPEGVEVVGLTTFSVISPYACNLQIAFYS